MRTTGILAGVVCLAAIAAFAPAYETLQGPTETRYWDKARAYNGYTLFAGHGRTFLIDMEGRVVHTWRTGTNPRLLSNGHILDATRDDPSGFQGFQEVDWDGKVVWRYTEKRKDYAPHHDWVRIFNKKLNAYTTLYIANRTITHEQAIAAGCDPAKGPYSARDQQRGRGGKGGKGGGGRGRGGGAPQVDAVVEVDMDGNIVWEWWFFDHVIQDVDPTKANYVGKGKTIADYPGRLNLNLPGKPVRGDWLHCNSLDYNAELDQIVINSVQGEFYVIDHGHTFVAGDAKASIAKAAGPAGDFLYRFGDPARYAKGDPPSILENWTKSTTGQKQIGGSHDVQWIKPGLPGAGNLLVFNNGQYLFEATPQSYIFEINGMLDAAGRNAGRYVDPPDAGYHVVTSPHDTHKSPKRISNHIVWTYGSKSNQGFFSHIGSGCQRLPNGNTLICADTEGHFIEVTPEGELVWEYVSPVTKTHGIVKVLPDSVPMTNAVFRAYRYGPDHPALKGRDLTPKGTITEMFGGSVAPRPERPRPEQRTTAIDDRPTPREPRAQEPQPRGGGGGRSRNPVILALDANGDGEVSAAEMAASTAALKKLDKDGDGRVSREEMRPPGGGGGQRDRRDDQRRGGDTPRRDDSPGRPDRPSRPAEDRRDSRPPLEGQSTGRDTSQRRPAWPLVHAPELDTDADGAVTLQEMLAQATTTFTGCDRDRDGKLAASEYDARDMPRTPMAGFVRGHARELDADRDGAISRSELLDVAGRMFRQADANGDGKLTADEYTEAVEFGKAHPKQQPGERPAPRKDQR